MKRLGKMFALLTVLLLALAACSTAIDDSSTPMSDGAMEEKAMEKETMEETSMEKDTMEKTDDHGAMDETMTKDDMSEDTMEKDDMSDETMEKDDMSDDGMEKDTMTMMNDGEPAPAFSLMNLEGDTVSLADFEGEKVYVKYWASWCSICVGGLPKLDELAGMDNDFRIITIVTPGFGGEKNAEAFKEWFAGKGTENLTVLLDTDGMYAKEFGVRGFPTSAYIGSDGVLVKTAPGDVGNDVIVANFEGIK